MLDKLTEILLNNWTDAYNKRHEHSNKTVIDKITQTLLDNWSVAYTHVGNKSNPHGVTAAQAGAAPTSHTHTKSQVTDMPTKLSQFTNDSGYLTAADVDTSQNHTHANKTVLDKITQAVLDKLAGIAEGANKYVHPTTGRE